jgi:hypothetical protein
LGLSCCATPFLAKWLYGGGEPESREGRDMARDEGLEELLENDLKGVRGLAQKGMFGGMAWLMNGNLLCGARKDSLLVRLGKGNDGWALKQPGIEPMVINGRKLSGWVRADARAYGNDNLRTRLIAATIEFNRTLPKKTEPKK